MPMAQVSRNGDSIVVSLDPAERETLTSLAVQVIELLESAPEQSDADPLEAIVGLSSDAVDAPEDEVLARLLPTAYRGDDEESKHRAAEFRRYTDADLRATKTTALQMIVDDLAAPSEAVLDEEQVQLWLHGLTDIRLALGTRLEITEDMAAEVAQTPPGSPRWHGLVLYDWLSLLQDSIVVAASGAA